MSVVRENIVRENIKSESAFALTALAQARQPDE